MRRLTILLATAGALLLVPAAQAFANGMLTVNIDGTGSGEVSSVGGVEGGGLAEGSPPIECAGPPPTGVCQNEMEEEFEGEEGLWAEAVHVIPAPGSKFAGWTIEEGFGFALGGLIGEPCEAESNPTECSVITLEPEDAKVTATFECETEGGCEGGEETPNLKLNVEEGEGTVVSNPAGLECTKAAPGSCEAEVAEGSVTLTASPAPGYLFKSWKGCDVGGVNGRQCKVTAGASLKTVGAKFYKVFSLEGSKSGGQGIMSTSPGGVNCGYACNSSSALYKEGALTVKAKAAKHFHFVEFAGGAGSASSCNGVTTPECTIASFNSNSAIEEVYAEDAKNTLTLAKEGGGQGFVKTKPTNINCGYTCTAAEAEFFAAETAEVTVALNKGTTKVTWVSGAGTCTGNALTCTVPMSASHSLVAKFE